jgi:hypothetical protein
MSHRPPQSKLYNPFRVRDGCDPVISFRVLASLPAARPSRIGRGGRVVRATASMPGINGHEQVLPQ